MPYAKISAMIDPAQRESATALSEDPRFGSPSRRSVLGVVWGSSVVADDDPFAFDPHDRLPGDDRVRLLGADAEVFEQGTASDAEAGDAEVGGGEFAAKVVEAAK
jgi:hypothetical protein